MCDLYFSDSSQEQKNKHSNNHNNKYQVQESDGEIYYDAEEEHYYDAQEFLLDPAPPFSTGELNRSALGEGPATASLFSALVRQLVGKTLFSIQLRLFARMGGMEELYSGLRRIAQSHKPLANRLLELSALLNRHFPIVPERHQKILRDAAELTNMGISLYQHGITWQEDISVRLRSFARQAEHLLSLELFRDYVAVDERHRLELMAKQLHKMALLLDLHQSMPEGSSFDEWLQGLARQEVLPDLVQERLLKYNEFSARLRELGEEVGEINQRHPLPAENDWAGRVNWVQQVLNDPTTAGQLKNYLSPDLEEMVNISAPLVQLINHFPTGNSLAEQLVWAGQKAIAPPPELLKLVALSPFSDFVTSARRNLNDKVINPALFNALLELASPGQSLWQKSLNIISLSFSGTYFREAISFALRSTVSTYLPGGTLLLNAWDWYQTLPEGLSWQETLERFTTDLQQLVYTHPHLFRAILPDTVLESAEALSVLIELPVGKSWQEILRWVSSRLGKEKEYDWFYERYLELSLARGVYEALKQGDNRQREAVLRELAEGLKGYLALRPDSGLWELLGLLPYLPLLAGIREEIIAMPGNDSWLGRACNLLTVLVKHPHLALTELRLQLETQIVNFLSDSMIAGVDAIWEQLPNDPLRFPEADAASIPEINYRPGTFWTQQQKTLAESNLAKHGDKKAQAERTSEETNAHGSAENKEFIISSQQADQFLDELLAMIDEYEKGSNSAWTKDDDAHFQHYAIFGGLTAGWLATLFLFWRAYRQVMPNHIGENDIEMQELNHHANPETVRNNNAEEGLLPDSPRPELSINKNIKRYLLPSILLSVMSGATAWAVWQRWGAENPLTLQQVFRRVLAEDNHTPLSEDAPVVSQGHTISKRSVAKGPIIKISSLRNTFLLWNVNSNESVKKIINNFEGKLKREGKEKQENHLLIAELVEYMFMYLKILTESISQSNYKKKEAVEEFSNVISMMVFMDKAVRKVEIIKPTLFFKHKLKTSLEYKKFQGAFSLTLVKSYITTPDDYTLYNVLRTGNLFSFEDLLQCKDYFTTDLTDYEEVYPGGNFHESVYAYGDKLNELYKFDELDSNDVIDNKKRALHFYLNKSEEFDATMLHSINGEVFHASTLEGRELMSYTGQRIIDVLSSITVHDKLIEKAQSEIKKGTSQTAQSASESWKSYHDTWKIYGISSFDTIDKYAREYNPREGGNIYLRGSIEAINKLLGDRDSIIEKLIINFNKPQEITQQCAIFLLLTRHINKIAAYQAELNKILNIASEIYSDTENYALAKKLNDKDFGFQSVINRIKIDAISKIKRKINKELNEDDSLDYYDLLMNDISGNTHSLKESILDYIKVREYFLYRNLVMKKLNVHGDDIDDWLRTLNIQRFNEFNRAILEDEALSYLIQPSAVERFTSLEQVSREASNYSLNDDAFYERYNQYINIDSRLEAKHDTFNLLMLNKNDLDTYQDVFEQPQSIEEYEITYFLKVSALFEMFEININYNVGSVKVITLSNNKKYMISTLDGFPFVSSYNEKVYDHLKSTRRRNIDDIIKNIYKYYADNYMEEFNNKFDMYNFKGSIPSRYIENKYFTINKVDRNNSLPKPIKDIVYDSIHSSYVKNVEALKEKGNKTPFQHIFSLIPFYSIIKHSLNDSNYYPTVGDMAWDIVDLSVSLALLGAKKFYEAVKVIKSILTLAEKSLVDSGKTLTGITRFHNIMTLSAPQIIKKFPTLNAVLQGVLLFTSNTLNPLGPFIFLGSKAVGLGKFAIKNIPKRGKKILHTDADSFIVQENKVAFAGVAEALGEQVSKDFKYIDEMTDSEILAAKNQLPEKLFSDVKLKLLATTPEGQCDKAAALVINNLSQDGYNTRVIGTLMYKTVLDTAPLNHYAVIASKDGVELVIDVTFDQFISKMNRKQQWVITSWEDWCRKITSSDKLQTSLIMSKEYKDLKAATSEIAFTDNRNYLESSYIRDPDFHTLLMPSRFIGHLNSIYKNDTKLISTSEGMLKLTMVDDILVSEQNKLKELITRENNHLDSKGNTPVDLLDKIEKTKRSISELEGLKLLPERVSNYLYINKNDFIKPGDKLQIHTPVSYKLNNLFESVEPSSTKNMSNVKSINEQGLAIIDNDYYIMHDEELYKITLADNSKNNATFQANNYKVNIEYRKFKWGIVEKNYRHTDSIIKDKLLSGSVSPLRSRGLLNASEIKDIEIPFDFIRLDKEVSMGEVKKFSLAELQESLTDKISTATGDKLSSKSLAGPVLGTWKQGNISHSVDFIEVANGSSGCVGIRIPYEQLPADRPVIVSGGELSGCTMIYATDNKYFYVYHSGQRPGDTNWLTSQQGVDEIYKAHLNLKGTTIPSLTTKKLTNEDLPTIFSEYQSSFITYFGKNTTATGNTRISQGPWSNVNTFDYNKIRTDNAQPRAGLAYAVLAKNNTKVNVTAYSEDLEINIKSGNLQLLASQHQVLNGHISSSQENVFETTIDTLEDLYTTFVGLRNARDLYKGLEPSSVEILNIPRQGEI